MIDGDVVRILVGPYAGGNGRVIRVSGKRVLLEVDPFGKQVWFLSIEVRE